MAALHVKSNEFAVQKTSKRAMKQMLRRMEAEQQERSYYLIHAAWSVEVEDGCVGDSGSKFTHFTGSHNGIVYHMFGKQTGRCLYGNDISG
jgi:hypothetical protein